MLDQKEIEYIENNSYIYDQNWKMYKNFLGEPFLLDDCLVYYDGAVLYACCFSLKAPNLTVNLQNIIQDISNIIPISDIKLIDAWGVLNTASFINNNPNARLIASSEKDESLFDSIIDVELFDLKKNRKARLAANAARNKGVYTRVVNRDYLTYQHIKLMNYFVETHDIKGPHKTIFLSINTLIHDKSAFLVEAYQENVLIGFAILCFMSKTRVSYCLACFDHSTKASDAVLMECISFCKTQKAKYLHLGYSGSDGLRGYKNKWGGSTKGILYEEYFFGFDSDDSINALVDSGAFLWRDRITNNEK